MRKKSTFKKCDRKFYKAVHLRDGCCQTCRAPGQAHRIILKSARPPASVRFDIDFALVLCPAGHEGQVDGRCDKDTAPHVSPKRFEKEVLPRLLNGMDPARAAKIRSQMRRVWSRSTEKPDYVAIEDKLDAEIAKYENNWMNADCECEFRPAM